MNPHTASPDSRPVIPLDDNGSLFAKPGYTRSSYRNAQGTRYGQA